MPNKRCAISEDDKIMLESAVKAAISELSDIEIVEIKYFYEYGKFNVSVLIWKKEGVSLDDCERVHNILSPALDGVEDIFEEEYILNVSSQGLDRRILSDDDFRRALDTEIEYETDNKRCHGTLVGVNGDELEIVTGVKKPEKIIISRKNITEVQPYIRF